MQSCIRGSGAICALPHCGDASVPSSVPLSVPSPVRGQSTRYDRRGATKRPIGTDHVALLLWRHPQAFARCNRLWQGFRCACCPAGPSCCCGCVAAAQPVAALQLSAPPVGSLPPSYGCVLLWSLATSSVRRKSISSCQDLPAMVDSGPLFQCLMLR